MNHAVIKFFHLVSLLVLWLSLSSFNYKSEWNKIDTIIEKKPKTAQTLLRNIEKNARAEGNLPEVLRCIMVDHRINTKIIDEEGSINNTLTRLKSFRKTYNNHSAAVAVAFCLEAEVLNHYYDGYCNDSERSEVLPKDFKEWEKADIKWKIRDSYKRALKNAIVKTTKASAYKTLFDVDVDGRHYFTSLYDLIQGCRIYNNKVYTKTEVLKIFDELIDFHKNDPDKNAYVFAKLDKRDWEQSEYAKFVYDKLNKFNRYKNNLTITESYVNDLEKMLATYRNTSASVLVRCRLGMVYYEMMSENTFDSYKDLGIKLNLTPKRLYDLCNKGITQYPNHPHAKELKKLIELMKLESVSTEIVKDVYRNDEDVLLKVSHANIANLQLNLHRYDCSPEDRLGKKHYELPNTKIDSLNYVLSPSDYFNRRDTILHLPKLDFGSYFIAYKGDTIDFTVSNFSAFIGDIDYGGGTIGFVVDSKTGMPMADVDVFGKDTDFYGLIKTTNREGEYRLTYNENYTRLFFSDSLKQDRFLNISNNVHQVYNSSNRGNKTIFFTDRAIYRPGQMVHFKVIRYRLDDITKVIENTNVTVKVRTGNYNTIYEKELTTNQYGSVADSFRIPKNALPGQFSISCSETWGTHYFKVEEYKCPTFEVGLVSPVHYIEFGEEVSVRGNAKYLNEAPLQRAKVVYTIVDHEGKRTTDSTYTNKYGDFEVRFRTKTKSDNVIGSAYSVNVWVTDLKGETHGQNSSFWVGSNNMHINCDNRKPQMEKRDLPKVKFTVTNFYGEPLTQKVNYEVYSDTVLVANGVVVSDSINGFSLPVETSNWKAGKYDIKLTVNDAKQHIVKNDFSFILFSTEDTCPPIYSELWIDNNETHWLKSDSDSVLVRVGTSLTDAWLLTVSRYSNQYSYYWSKLSNKVKIDKWKLQAGSDKLYVDYFIINNGQLWHQSVAIRKKPEDKTLKTKLSVFRNKVQPGAKEQWTLHVEPARGEMMATMYDASLDLIVPMNVWHLDNKFKKYQYLQYWNFSTNKGEVFRYSEKFNGNLLYSINMFHLNESIYSPTIYDIYSEDNSAFFDVEEEVGGDNVEEAYKEEEETEPTPKRVKEMPTVRMNFSETAFFIPHKSVDAETGDVRFTFTVPDYMTRWKFMALVHDVDVNTGTVVQEIVSQKDFYISPNYPRFLRMGDTCSFTANVANLTENAQKGVAKMQLLDAVTENIIVEQTVNFELGANKVDAVEWKMAVPNELDAVLVRVTAETESFADAEQKILPILPNHMTLTQTMPLCVRGGQTKEFDLKNLTENTSASLKNKLLKLEICENPVWNVVKCMPEAANCLLYTSINLSASLYINALSQKVIKDNPIIGEVVGKWIAKQDSSNALLSNLQKNEDVKEVRLCETPWTKVAVDENKQMAALHGLLDTVAIKEKCDNLQNHLDKLRSHNGGYYWICSFGKPSVYSTLFVLDNYACLQRAGIQIISNQRKKMLDDDVNFLDRYFLEKYEDIKKKTTGGVNYHVSVVDLYYLRIRSQFKFDLRENFKDSYKFYYELMKKQWPTSSLYGKALAAICLENNGEHEAALQVVNSLRKLSAQSDEMGMYWPSNKSTWQWEDDAISTQANIMEAFYAVDPVENELSEMGIWLLNQKRTSLWDNDIANAEAIKALLMNNTNILAKANNVRVEQGGNTITEKEKTEGLGSYSVTYTANEIKPEMGKVKLTSEAGGNISWGGLYWQFDDAYENIKSNSNGLAVTKTVKIRKQIGDETVLADVDEQTLLHVGDKLSVRLVVKADRDYEFVCLKDQRASCLEPELQTSQTGWTKGAFYYQVPKDASMCFFFNHLPKGTHVFDYNLYVTHRGNYNNGLSQIQCLYAPEFSANTGSERINVVK